MAKEPTRLKALAKPKPTGIQAGCVHPIQEFCERMGWGRKAFTAARRRGLPVRRESRFVYVITDEAIAWMKEQSAKV